MNSKIKKFGSETLIYGTATVLGRFFIFMLTPMYTNILKGPQFDFIIYLYSLLAFVNVVYSFGMESSFFKFFTKDNPEEGKKVFTHAFVIINLISLIFTIIILFSSGNIAVLLGYSNVPDAGYIVCLAALISFVDALILIPFGYLRMTRQARKFALIRFMVIVVTVIMNFIFLKVLNMQAEGVLLAQLTASGFGALYFFPLILKNFLTEFDINLFIRMVKFGIPTLPANLSAIVLQVADRPILKALSQTSDSIVTYQVNYKLGIPMMIFVTVFEYAWKPFYLSNYHEDDAKKTYSRIFSYFTLVSAVIFLIVTLFIGYVVKMPGIGGKYFIKPDYWSGLSIVPIILLAYYFNGVFSNVSAGFLINKQTKYLPLAVGLAAVINIAANFTLIPVLGYVGAAWATLLSYFVSAAILFTFSRKIYPVNYEWKRVGIIIACTSVIFILDKILSGYFTSFAEFGIKILLLVLFIFSLKLFKFYTTQELSLIRGMFTKKTATMI